ncbi:glycosyltransferase family 2 protein [Deinococcus yavapaiensis]|uniref:Glycosyltransferase involved in cell wall biosynthesis n=1 Tax=Deinococcus yavapaiensis KR-236 TaxID=694435 RepID=A0A318S6M8_9DEIO|nr:glycosyltransferase family 2 protein [Deinococcus yavapaiensis]PYE54424.1 glycosyltransferase involved in cell wall biosynthesis [Deinococcus yavapaiensis KR-236]
MSEATPSQPSAYGVAVIIPAFNEESTIVDVVRPALAFTREVVVVSDGSTDGTARVAREAGAIVVELHSNGGKGPALYAGLLATNADIVILLDADLVGLTPEHLHTLLAPVANGELDMAIGVFNDGGFMTDFGNRMTKHLSGQRAVRREWLLGVPRLASERWPEPAITYALKNDRVKWGYVELHKLKQVMKEEKRGLWQGLKYRTKMYKDLLTFRKRRKERCSNQEAHE